MRKTMILQAVLCVVCSVSLMARDVRKPSKYEKQILDKHFDFLSWAEKSGKRGIFHAHLKARELIGPEYTIGHPAILYGNNGGDAFARHSFFIEKRTNNAVLYNRCYMSETHGIWAAHRVLASSWMPGGMEIREPEFDTLSGKDIGNKHFVNNKDDPTVIAFARGNVVVTLVSRTEGKTVIPMAEEIDRRLQMKHLTGAAADETEEEDGGAMAPTRKVKPGKQVVLARNVEKEKKSISVVTSSGTLHLNDKDQLILDTRESEEKSIKIWKVVRERYRIECGAD